MIERTAERVGLRPDRLAADGAYGPVSRATKVISEIDAIAD
jgi:hypothetical protein